MQKNKMVKQKERPILFGLPMVQAILSRQKTQTRRVVKNVGGDNCVPYRFFCEKEKKYINGLNHVLDSKSLALCPYGQVGDRLWVRETHTIEDCDDGQRIIYKADMMAVALSQGTPVYYLESDYKPKSKWKPSIFMPRWASRILLEITNVRVERLRDISRQDAIAEGIKTIKITCSRDGEKTSYKAYDWPNENITKNNPIDSYFSLWESINGRESLEANPFVWVIEFKRVGGAT